MEYSEAYVVEIVEQPGIIGAYGSVEKALEYVDKWLRFTLAEEILIKAYNLEFGNLQAIYRLKWYNEGKRFIIIDKQEQGRSI